MRESRTYGSVRGARGNSRPYRVLIRQSSATAAMHTPLLLWVNCTHYRAAALLSASPRLAESFRTLPSRAKKLP